MSTIILLTHSANRESVQSLHLSRRRVGQARRARQPVTLGSIFLNPVTLKDQHGKEGGPNHPGTIP